MPFNLLLLPLLGGFLFLRYWNPTRYHSLRAEAERLLILAAIPGVLTLVIAFLLMKVSQFVPYWRDVSNWWRFQVPFEYLGTSLTAFGLGALGWIPLNLLPWFSRDRAIDKMIEHDSIPLDQLLKKAQDEAKTVSVTMSNGKVYVGFVTHLLNPGFPTTFIEILPTKSGYRDSEKKTVTFTTFYSNVLDQLEKDYDAKLNKLLEAENRLEARKKGPADNKKDSELAKLEVDIAALAAELEASGDVADDFGIVLPVCEIHSVNIFREEIHTEHFAPHLSSLTLPPS